MSRMQVPAKPSAMSRALARDRLGVPAVLFFVLAGVAPLTVSAGVIPSAYATTGLTGIPAAFIVIAFILALFAVGYVAMTRHITNAGACGLAHTTPDRDAVALWLPAGPGAPGPPDGYSTRLAVITGPLIARFEAFDAALEARHPVAVLHQHLAILAVRPGRQGQRTGTTLLAARHATLEAEGIPAFLEASSPDSRRLHLRHGYADYGHRIELPGGPPSTPCGASPTTPTTWETTRERPAGR